MKTLFIAIALTASVSALYAAAPTNLTPSETSQICASDSVDLSQFAGKYKMTGLPFDYVTIAVKDGQLTIDTGSESGVMTAVKDSPDTFDAGGRATLKFKRDDAKKVTGVTLDAQGMTFDGTKES